MKKQEETRLKISYLSRLYQSKIDMLISDLGVSGSQSLIIDVIYYREECSQKEIADYLQVSTAAITKALKNLETKQLVIKKQADYDLRSNTISLTEDGRLLAKKIIEIVDHLDSNVFSQITVDQLDNFNNIINKIITNIQSNKVNLDYKKSEFESLYNNYKGD